MCSAAKWLLGITAVSFLVVWLSSLGIPYQYSASSPTLRRLNIQVGYHKAVTKICAEGVTVAISVALALLSTLRDVSTTKMAN